MRITAVVIACSVTLLLAACSGEHPKIGSLDSAADAYVRLVLAVGRHDRSFVDAYFGPPDWLTESNRGEPTPLGDLLREARALLGDVRSAESSERREFLEKQLRAVEAFLRIQSGEKLPLAEETRLLYDIEVPSHGVSEFEAARTRLENLVPGEGELGARLQAFRDRFQVPRDRLEAVVRKCLEITRERTAARVTLPAGETFRVAFVQGKPWGAYNWYRGDYHSLIEVNTDLPSELGRVLDTVAHEGYPGHHAYNALLEETLVRGKGWRELTVYPLYSPQSLVAEGTANAGISIVLSDADELMVLRDTLAPLAGIDPKEIERYQAVREAAKALRVVHGEAARMILEGGRSEEEAIRFVSRYGLETEERARKAIEFVRAYRSYVFNYTVGEDLVNAYLGSGPGRTEKFFELLKRPMTPSGLVAATSR